tara:strand:- start:243 stop:677 length:435 start_codon:yes stop_codon:yes gene_type:complete
MVKRCKQVKQRGKSSKKPLVKGKGSAKKRVSKRSSSKRKKTPKAHGKLEMQALVNKYFSEPLTNNDVLEIKQIVEKAIDSLPNRLKRKYDNLDTSIKESIKKTLKIEVHKMKKQKYTNSEIMSRLDGELEDKLDKLQIKTPSPK